MVGFALHVQWPVRCFGVWLELFRVQVQGNIKEVNDFFVCFDDEFQVTLSEYMSSIGRMDRGNYSKWPPV